MQHDRADTLHEGGEGGTHTPTDLNLLEGLQHGSWRCPGIQSSPPHVPPTLQLLLYLNPGVKKSEAQPTKNPLTGTSLEPILENLCQRRLDALMQTSIPKLPEGRSNQMSKLFVGLPWTLSVDARGAVAAACPSRQRAFGQYSLHLAY